MSKEEIQQFEVTIKVKGNVNEVYEITGYHSEVWQWADRKDLEGQYLGFGVELINPYVVEELQTLRIARQVPNR